MMPWPCQGSHNQGTKEQDPHCTCKLHDKSCILCQDATLHRANWQKINLNYTIPGPLHWQEAVKPDSPFPLVCYLEINCTAWCTNNGCGLSCRTWPIWSLRKPALLVSYWSGRSMLPQRGDLHLSTWPHFWEICFTGVIFQRRNCSVPMHTHFCS